VSQPPGARSIFLDDSDRPRFVRSAVLFLDILGVSDMATDPAHNSEHLLELDQVLRRTFRDFLADGSPWPSALLSDSLIVTNPTTQNSNDAFVLGEMLIQAAILQLQLAAGGFFARGALTIGDIHIHDRMVFGPALVETYEEERRRAVNPRVVLTRKACDVLRADMATYPDPTVSPGADFLIVDQDGVAFIDYLKMILDELDPMQELERHRSIVEGKLAAHQQDGRKWEKYRWVAEYHNHFCGRTIKDGPLIPVGEMAMRLQGFC
jgi:hypothetical protein